MCEAATGRRLDCMAARAEPGPSGAESRRFGLDVELHVEPIQGRVYEDGGALDRPFSGWLGLIAAIEAARGAHPAPPYRPRGAGR